MKAKGQVLTADVRSFQAYGTIVDGKRPDGSWNYSKVVWTGDLRIILDIDALLRAIGDRALRNRSKRTQLQSGALVIEASNVLRYKV